VIAEIAEYIAIGLIVGGTVGRLLSMVESRIRARKRAKDAERGMGRMPSAGSVFYPWNRR
jgi:hypothetical protein